MKRFLCLAAVIGAVLISPHLTAEEPPGVYVILDGSGSMWGQLADGTHKITAAKEVVMGFSADDFAGRDLAFRVYGHRRKGDCSDSELVVPFSTPSTAIARMAAFAEDVNPKGKTPISRSLRAALEDFGDRSGEIVLVSDGIETCDEDPCALVRAWQEKNVDIRVHVVGLGLEGKEKAAMQCISEAAGTEYRDAQSSEELAAGLKEIQDSSGDPGDSAPPEWQVLEIRATNASGERMRVQGTAQSGEETVSVANNGYNRVPPGEAEVTVGVRTKNGNLYQPVTRTVLVEDDGKTVLEVVVPEPPSVKARFLEGGEKHKGSFVYGYQGDEQVLGFRSKDRAYLDPGTYEFRSRPNADNDLAVTESFADGDHKEIVFEMVTTVRAKIKMYAAGSDHLFRAHAELWQGGEKKYGVHLSNGAQVLPGTYEARLPLQLTPYVVNELVITTEDPQEHRIEVPVGYVTARYQNADGSPAPDKRCYLTRKNESGKWVRDRISYTGKRIPLVAGEYQLEGWSSLGTFDPIFFSMTAGEEKELVLRNKTEP